MSATRVFVARLAGCSVFDPAGDRVGKVRDVLVVYRSTSRPRVVGLIVEIPGQAPRVPLDRPGDQHRRRPDHHHRPDQPAPLRAARRRGAGDRRTARPQGRRCATSRARRPSRMSRSSRPRPASGRSTSCSCAGRAPAPRPFGKGADAVRRAGTRCARRRRRARRSRPSSSSRPTPTCCPADLATTLLDLPEERRLEVAEELPDERLADALEEMTEEDQVELINQLDDDRAADVLDQMQPDDAADLIAQLPRGARRGAARARWSPEEADDVRFLLAYAPDTAGGLMTTEPIIVSADATVAEGLALIRRHELAPALGAAVCVTLPPYEPPTGRFLGVVHFQRMLRYPPQRAARHAARPQPRARDGRHQRRRGVAHPGQLQPGLAARRR